MTRPFKLYSTVPTTLEIKYGRKTSRAAEKLHYLLVVSREREEDTKGVNNFKRRKDITDAVVSMDESFASDENPNYPNIIPIRLLSDNPAENFSLFRGFFDKNGTLGCGAKYGDDKALRRKAFQEDIESGKIEGEEDVPYEVDCNPECKWWQSDGRLQCDLTGTLYFRLAPNLPASNQLGVVRVKGTFAQRSITSSMNLLREETGGILRGLPLQIRLHFEQRSPVNDSRSYPVPFLTIEPRQNPDDFRKSVLEEIGKRKEEYKIRHMKEPESIKELMVTGVTKQMNSRDAILHDMSSGEFDTEITKEPEKVQVTEEQEEILEGFSDQLKKVGINESTVDGEVDIDKLKEFAEEHNEHRQDLFEIP